MKKDPAERLFEGIKAHEWFKDINWKELEEKKVEPAFVPSADKIKNFFFFDPEILQEEAGNQFNKD